MAEEAPAEILEEAALENDESAGEMLEPIKSKMIISVFPNPTTDYFNIEMEGGEQYLLQMFDGRGRQVKISKIGPSSSRIDASTLEPGSYLIRISNSMGDQVETRTLIVI